MTNKFNFLCVLVILTLTSLACNFSTSTANLSDVKLGKDKDASSPMTSFNANDEIFVVTGVNSAIGKNKVKFRVLFDKVDGSPTGTVAYKLEKEMDVEGSRAVWFNFSMPGGFAPGSYKTEVILTNEEGKELERKNGSFTITGNAKPKTTETEKPETKDEESSSSDDN